VLRFLLWRMLGLIALVVAIAFVAWLLRGGLDTTLRGAHAVREARHLSPAALASALGGAVRSGWEWAPGGVAWWRALLGLALLSVLPVGSCRVWARRRRRYVRLRVHPYRTDTAGAQALVSMFEALHRRLLHRWWRRLLRGQPSVALEVHHSDGCAWLAVSCPAESEDVVQAALRTAYPNCRLAVEPRLLATPPAIVRCKKHAQFIKRARALEPIQQEREPAMNRLLTVMGACACDAFVQVAMTPAPMLFEQRAKRLYKRHEARLSRERRDHLQVRDRSMVEDEELFAALVVQHSPLFFVDLRIVAPDRDRCEQIASELRAGAGENRLVERGTTVRHGLLGLYTRRALRGEGNPLPSWRTGVFACTELAAIWHLPSVDYATVPFQRAVLPCAPAPPAIMRPAVGPGTLRDARGAVSIHPDMRRQNTAVPGTVEQGKSSYLVATVAEDLRRERCAIIVLDPKGDAAEAAVSQVPVERTCTLLDFADPTCGFNPLAVDAPADVIADYVVAALKHLFTDADIRASSDRYLRNAIIAVLAYDRSCTLWDAARLLSVGEEGYSYRARVAARVRSLPEFKEISEFFAAELTAQLADARSTTTAKLDAPVNKLARLLNSPSIKRVLLNDSLRIDFDRVIARREVLVVKGALGAMGAGNTSVLMQLLAGMLDAALARQQDLVPAAERVAVALKVDEAPLVLNRGFAETMALKRSAGLETVACWQTEAQWLDIEIREQLDALFAHRVYFATASVSDARTAASLTMAEFSDMVRPGIPRLSALSRPDARLHLPRHHAIASWTTPQGRQSPFIAETIPLRIDPERIAVHAARQAQRGGRYLADLSQPHWDREHAQASGQRPTRSRDRSRPDPPDSPDSPDSPAPPDPPKRPRPSSAHVQPDPAPRVSPERAARPEVPAESYRELVELDGAHSVRWDSSAQAPRPLQPEPRDLEILTLIAGMGHVLSSQIHRRFNPARAVTTTQRRLKRLSDAGLVRRFQFHRADGGGVPMCYAIALPGLRLLHAHERLTALGEDEMVRLSGAPSPAAPDDAERLLRQARHDIHVTGWALALEHAFGGARLALRGARESALSPPSTSSAAERSAGHGQTHTEGRSGGEERSGPNRRVTLGLNDLRLPGGRTPHEFLRTDRAGGRAPVQRFETIRPDATIELPERLRAAARVRPGGADAGMAEDDFAIDLLVELDDRLPTGGGAGKIERYDHFLAGWSLHTRRYGSRQRVLPVVVLVCRDRARARECARMADAVLTACRAYAGEYPADWRYPGRERILFAAERDVHDGSLHAYGVPPLPPDVRASVAHGDQRAREPAAEVRDLLAFALAPAGG
jgi:Replication-relaxation